MTIRKGTHALDSGFTCLDAFAARGRKPVEAHLPTWRPDIPAIVDRQSQTAPQLRTQCLYTPWSAAEVRRQLIAQKGYRDDARPTVQPITAQRNTLGYYPKNVAKSPPKKIPETEAIFAQGNPINQASDSATDVLRVSMDAKATVQSGPFARGGKSRAVVAAADHDCAPEATVTPVGLFLPTLAALCVSGVTAKVTSDCLVDCLTQWWEAVRDRFPHLPTLVINLDNGPKKHRRRTQLMPRLVAFVPPYHLTVRLAYSLPYHSKYNPIERCWGILEHHWNGPFLDSLDPVLQCARTMTWNGTPPVVELVTTADQTGVTLTPETMEAVEARLTRLPKLEKWFVDLVPPAIDRDT